jgi:flavodoxin
VNAVVVYDTWYGNTEQIARAVAVRLGSPRLVKVSPAGALDLAGCDLLVIGSPTHGGGMSVGMRQAVPRMEAKALERLRLAVFDTRFHEDISHTGSAAVKIAQQLVKKGARLVVPPESFFVKGLNGPLEEGELARAPDWAARVADVVRVEQPMTRAARPRKARGE